MAKTDQRAGCLAVCSGKRMGISIAQQTTMFLYALLLGGVIGAVYDVFRVSRVAFRLSWLLVLLQDILFFTLSALLLWRYFLLQSSGEVRIFVVLGVLLGWIIYFFTLGRLVMRLAGFIIGIITRIVTAILAPVRKIAGVVKKTLYKQRKLMISGKNRLKSRLYMLYNKHKRLRGQIRSSKRRRGAGGADKK